MRSALTLVTVIHTRELPNLGKTIKAFPGVEGGFVCVPMALF